MSRQGLRRFMGHLLLLAGFFSLVLSVGTWRLKATIPLPYFYRVLDSSPKVEGALASFLPSLKLKEGEVIGRDSRKLARFRFFSGQDIKGRILIAWDPLIDEPFLKLFPDLEETLQLAEVIKKHFPRGAHLMAWWDISRLLKVLTGVPCFFESNLFDPIFIPPAWRALRSRIRDYEFSFWGTPLAGESRLFQAFTRSLLLPVEGGRRALLDLGKGGKLILVLHIRDAILMGQLYPSNLGIAFRDFPEQGDLHGSARSVRDWVAYNGYPAYTLYRPREGILRVVALTRASDSLLVRLLPFVGAEQEGVPGIVLVYQLGGYWVYELTP